VIIVADSGGTKTVWYYSSPEKSGSLITSGLHPQSLSRFSPQDTETIMPLMVSSGRLYFYGTGCYHSDHRQEVYLWLKQRFPLFEIIVESDLIGSATALHGTNSGLVGILGTGSSLGVWNGSQLVLPIPSLGWMIGDPGSGTDIARRFFTQWYSRKFPDNLNQILEQNPAFDSAPMLIEKIYSSPSPTKDIAAYCKEISSLIHFDPIRRIVQYSFHDFFDYYEHVLKQYASLPLAFSGGIAHAFKPILSAVAQARGYNIFAVIDNPIKQLAAIHFSEYRSI